MKQKKIISLLLAATLSFTLLAGCGSKTDEAATDTSTDAAATTTEATEGAGEVREFTAFFAVAGTEINDDNEIQSILAEKTGVKVKETWLTGQTDKEAIGTFIAGGEYPDFIEGDAIRKSSGGNYSEGLASISAVLKEAGHKVSLMHINHEFDEKEFKKKA